MKTTNLLSTLSFLFIFFTSVSLNANNTDPIKSESNKEPAKTIVDVAVGNENFSTLVAAVKAADLVGTLNSEGPFTVFAPTNDAFAKLPEGTVESLLKEENREALTAVLTYHVVAGEFKAADVLKAIKENGGMFEIPTVNGEKLTAHLKDGKVMLKDAQGNMSTIIMTDVDASNGIIHAIDTVVMP
ncbi:fasciclin domain-containing protein [Lutimonas saemankumensis]|uniref:fasciclin domain-containing protein n=1 Tax=Lutimonas saemankumensis TaxID=483016 RepID=UPI001CD3BCBB|nr:fasciclin domain-containing protein [Lutimonas saemankumensis]MCA0933337.1 fasciclin domain-containing protein [Lutimonas saemankumensis]